MRRRRQSSTDAVLSVNDRSVEGTLWVLPDQTNSDVAVQQSRADVAIFESGGELLSLGSHPAI